MTISAGSIPCPPYIADQEQHRKAITQWMMRVSPFVTPSNTSNFVTEDSLSAALAGVAGTFVTASQFNVQGDTRRIYSNVTIALSATTLNVPTGSFSAADIGKAITLQWNSATGAHTSTILSVSSATNIGLSTQFPAAMASTPAIVTFGTDDRSAMQAAIAGCISLGGATLYVKAGFYTIGGMLSIGSTMTILGDGWKGLRSIAGSTTLDWSTASPPFGTILFANFMQVSASACVRVAAHSCQIKNLEFEVLQPMPGNNWAYLSSPWCIKAYRAPFQYEGGDGLYIENVMLRNPSKGVRFQGTSRGWVNGLFGQPFIYGLYVSGNYDVFRAENVHWWPFYDVGTYVMSAQSVLADGIVLGKVDNPMFHNIFGFHLRSLFHLFNSNEVDISPNGWTQRMHVTNAGADDCAFGFLIQDNAGIDVTDMYAYCFSTSAAAVPSCAFYSTAVIGQGETTRLNLTNIDITGCTGNAMRFETPTQLNVSNLRLQSFNLSNLGYAAISLAGSSTANVVNVIDYNNHFSSSLFEALAATAVFNFAVGANIAGDITITGGINGRNGLSISGGAIITGNVFIQGGINGSNGLSISGGMVLTGAANIGYDTSISGALTVVGGINGHNGLSISGGAIFTGAMNIGSDLSVGGTLLVTQGITGKNGLSISGGIVTTGNVFVGGDLTVSGNVIAGGITFTNLFIPGTTTLSGATVITQGLTVRNGISISGGIATTGSGIIGADLSVSGNALIGGGLTIKAGLSVSGGIAITGNFIAQNADLSGALSVGSNLFVSGGITGKAGLSISGGVAMTGNLIAQAADFSSALSVGGTVLATGGITGKDGLSISGGCSITGNFIGQAADLSGAVSVGGAMLVTGGITSKAGLSVSGGIAITGAFIMGVPGNYANDAAAAAGGVSVGQLYRNGSALQIRVS